MKTKYTSGLSLLFLLASLFFSKNLSAQGIIEHQTGAFYNDYDANGMQKTHTIDQIVYVNPSQSTVTLSIPSQGNASPHQYFRWYKFGTDNLSPNLVAAGTMYANGYVRYGGTTNLYTMTYNVNPANLPDTIACDLSSYKDYTLVNNFLTTEPTLSYRCIYIIRDAHEIASQLQDSTNNNAYLQESVIYMPAVPASTHQLPRVAITYNRSNYFGYDGNGFLSQQAQNFHFAGSAYSSDQNRFIFINPGAAGTTSEVTVKMTVGTAGLNAETYNLARFKIHFIAETPKDFLASDLEPYRSIAYMDSNYYLLSVFDLDFDTQPATAANNMWSSPLEPDICEYGFVSEKLYNAGYTEFNNKVAQWNEYGFYKTANVPLPGLTGYTWYNGGKKVYDRKYYQTNGAEQGYFMYIDAAETPGVIARIPLPVLCAGTKLFVSGAIASLTTNNATSYPDISGVFYGIKSDGTEVELSRYTSGDIPSYTGSDHTPWYQAYYYFTFEENNEFVSYLLQLENNCTSTGGGDYAVDDLRIYRSKPSVQAQQLELPCGSDGSKIKVLVEYDKLLSSLGIDEVTSGNGSLSGFKYKILDSNSNPLSGYNYNTGGTPNYNYGQLSLSSKFSEMTPLQSGQDPPVATGDLNVVAYTQTDSIDNAVYRYVVFLIPNTDGLEVTSTYSVVVADSNDNFGTGVCSLASDPFTITPSSSITVNGSSWVVSNGLCYGDNSVIGVILRDLGGSSTTISALFDWYYGTLAEYQSTVPGYSYSVMAALDIYRSVYPNPDASDTLSVNYQGTYTQEIHDLLRQQIDEGNMILNQATINRVIRHADVILAIPLAGTVSSSSGANVNICTDIIVLNAIGPSNNPTMQLGNEYFKNLRMGLFQWNDLQQNPGKTVTIPVFDFVDADSTKSRALVKATDASVYLIDTDDPSISVDPGDVSTFIVAAALDSVNISNAVNDHIVINIPAGTNFVAHEGYTYTFEFHFNQATGISEPSVCDGTGIFTVKMVPEYLTWTGADGDNWNNDNNWRRSTGGELYMSGYTDDPDSHGFVPMDSCKVTIPPTNGTTITKSPWLYYLSGTPFPDMDNTNYTNAGDKLANAATDSIQYDLVLTKATGTNYNCVNFYGNTADQIYFKSKAEMRNTNYLTYNKAYVDFELTSGRWYMLSSPLQNVVAGDMYLPTSSGRQETQAFNPITYSTTENNRFDPPVYQQSWDKANSTLFKQDGSSEDVYIATTWSQVYNKVDESYDGGKGFSVKAMYGTLGTDTVMFRLPKDDNAYLYYSFDGQVTGNSTAISRQNNGRLVFENNAVNVVTSLSNQSNTNNIFLAGNPFMARLDMNKFFNTNTGFERTYWIITAGGLSVVQIATDGTITSSGDENMDGTVAPMQAFFIESTGNVNAYSATYAPDMTIASANASQNSIRSSLIDNEPEPKLKIKATRGSAVSNILIQKRRDADNGYNPKEDAQVIMDSNLKDIPVLYTMSGTKAVMINRVNDLDSIPLGVFSNSDDEVILTFEGTDSFSEGLFLYDKLLNESVTLDKSVSSVAIPGNTYGRYYLKLSSATDMISGDHSLMAYSPDKGNVVIKCSSFDNINSIRVYNLSGMLVKELPSVNNTYVNMSLPAEQNYILKVVSDLNNTSIKVYCK